MKRDNPNPPKTPEPKEVSSVDVTLATTLAVPSVLASFLRRTSIPFVPALIVGLAFTLVRTFGTPDDSTLLWGTRIFSSLYLAGWLVAHLSVSKKTIEERQVRFAAFVRCVVACVTGVVWIVRTCSAPLFRYWKWFFNQSWDFYDNILNLGLFCLSVLGVLVVLGGLATVVTFVAFLPLELGRATSSLLAFLILILVHGLLLAILMGCGSLERFERSVYQDVCRSAARKIVQSFVHQYQDTLGIIYPPALLIPKLNSTIPDGCEVKVAWQAASDLIAGMKKQLEELEGRRRQRQLRLEAFDRAIEQHRLAIDALRASGSDPDVVEDEVAGLAGEIRKLEQQKTLLLESDA